MTPRLTCFPRETLMFSSSRMFPLLKIGAVYANRPPTVNPIFVLTWRTYTLRKQWVSHPFQPRRGSSHIIKSICFLQTMTRKAALWTKFLPQLSLYKGLCFRAGLVFKKSTCICSYFHQILFQVLVFSLGLSCLKIDWILSFQIAVQLCSSRSHAASSTVMEDLVLVILHKWNISF